MINKTRRQTAGALARTGDAGVRPPDRCRHRADACRTGLETPFERERRASGTQFQEISRPPAPCSTSMATASTTRHHGAYAGPVRGLVSPRVPDGWRCYVIDADWLHIEAGSAAFDIDHDGDLDLLATGDDSEQSVLVVGEPVPPFCADGRLPYGDHRDRQNGAVQLQAHVHPVSRRLHTRPLRHRNPGAG